MHLIFWTAGVLSLSKLIFSSEIMLCLQSMLLVLKKRTSDLRIQVRAPRSLKNPRSKQGHAENTKGIEPNCHKDLLIRMTAVNVP